MRVLIGLITALGIDPSRSTEKTRRPLSNFVSRWKNKDVRINIPGEKCSTYVKKEGSGRSSAGYERIGLRFDNRKKT